MGNENLVHLSRVFPSVFQFLGLSFIINKHLLREFDAHNKEQFSGFLAQHDLVLTV